MNRRRFLALSGHTTLALFVPPLLACDPASLPPDHVKRAIDRARIAGKPLLVLVCPRASETSMWGGHVGNANGQDCALLLAHGSDEALADLLLCEVICARVSRVAELVKLPAREGTVAEPLWIRVDVGADTAAEPVATVVDPPEWSDGADRRDPESRIDARIRSLSELAHSTIVPDAAALGARARRAKEALTEREVAAIERVAKDPERCDDALAVRGAALLLSLAESHGQRPAAIAKLARIARAQWKDAAPQGAHWEKFEGDPCPGCGMARVSERSRTFLSFEFGQD